MTRRCLTPIASILAILALSWVCAGAQGPAYRPGELLVQYKPKARSAVLSRAETRHGDRVLGSLAQGIIQHVALPSDMSVEHAMVIYAADPDVILVEPNYLLSPQSLPQDPYFEKQWGLHNTGQVVAGYTGKAGADIDLIEAWRVADGTYGAIVAVVDTGCNLLHPDLLGNLWTNPGETPNNGIDDDRNGYVDDVRGWDFVDDDNMPQDASGHGTHVAGIIASSSDNGIGVSGIGRRVQVMPLRFMDTFDQGSVSDAIAAISYAVANGARIINCSWGTTGYSSALRKVMASVDALFVCAAGNSGANNDALGFYPANFALENIISVAATDQQDELAWFSNYGRQKVHVAAPGVRIFSLGLGWRVMLTEDFGNGLPEGWMAAGQPDLWHVKPADGQAGTAMLAVCPGETYPENANAWVVMPAIDLSESSATRLTFQLVGEAEADKDFLYIETATDLNRWSVRPVHMAGEIVYGGISGRISRRTTAVVDLGPWDGTAGLYVRLRFQSDAVNNTMGYFIDNVVVSAASDDEVYQFMSGTSMASAFVSGITAFLQTQAVRSTVELAVLIEAGVDINDALSSRVVTAGRVNAFNSLMLIDDPAYVDPNRVVNDSEPGAAQSSGGGDGGGCLVSMVMF